MAQEQVHYCCSGYCCPQISSAVDKSPAAATDPYLQLEVGVERMAQTDLGFVGRRSSDLQRGRKGIRIYKMSADRSLLILKHAFYIILYNKPNLLVTLFTM